MEIPILNAKRLYLLATLLVALLATAVFDARPAYARTFEVDSAGDASDADLSDGVCATVTGTCTFRAAVEQANRRNSGGDRITFDVGPGCPSEVIIEAHQSETYPGADDSAAYVITAEGLEIDGYTQCGAHENSRWIDGNADIRIGIEPGTADPKFGLDVRAANVEIRGLAVYGWKSAQINYEGPGDDGVVQGNFIGLSPSESQGDRGFGLRIAWGAKGTLVGGPNPADRNIIGGTGNDGVSIQGFTVRNVRVENNYIGVKQDGESEAGNKDGVDLQKGPSHNTIINNVLSGNNGEGIELSHDSRGQFNYVIGNLIGVTADGTDDEGNNTGGLTFDDSFSYNYIQDNIISGNRKMGVRFNAAYYNVVENNMIGVSIELNSSDRKLVGFRASDYFDSDDLIDMPNGTSSSQSGERELLRSGIEIYEVSSGNIIRNNIIANHPWSGIRVRTNVNLYGYTCFEEGNTFSQNRMYNNGLKGIALIPGQAQESTLGSTSPNQQHGPIPSGPPEHWPPDFIEPLPPHPAMDCTDANGNRVYYTPNENMQPPVIDFATPDFVVGTACANCIVEVFSAAEQENDNFAGEGKVFLGSVTADASGYFAVPVLGVAKGERVTSTATNQNGSTSEFSLNVTVSDPPANACNTTPGTVKATLAHTGDDVQLSWTAASNVAAYRVYRQQNNPYFDVATAEPYAQQNLDQLSFDDPGVFADMANNYYYAVLGVDVCGNYSPEAARFGVVTLSIAPDWNLLTLPVIPPNGSLDGVLGTQLNGTADSNTADRVLIWDNAGQIYRSAWLCGGSCQNWGQPWANHWLADDYSQSTLTLGPNTGFWVQNRSGDSEQLRLAGRVPTAAQSVNVGAGWQMLGSSFPDSRAIGAINLTPTNNTYDPITADRILYWDAAGQQYQAAWFCGTACDVPGMANTWLDDNNQPSNIVLDFGTGFWYQNRANTPFMWNNPPGSN